MTYAKFGSEPSKDRWHQLADAIQDSNLPASDKAIFRYLLDKADYVTAPANPKFAVLQRTIGKKTSISLRQVIYSLEHLAQHGWVAVGKAHEDKRRTTYTLSAGWACDCTGRRHVADQSVTSATQSVTARKVQHRRSEDVPIADVAVVTDVAHSAGDGFPAISADARKVQPDGQIGATPAPYIGATDRCNAAGQTPLPTERHREEGVKGSAEKQEPVKLKPPPAQACPRHQTRWGPHPHCLACRALAESA